MNRRAFTVIELVVVILVIVALLAVLLPAVGRHRYTGAGPRQIKDSTQIRGIHQGLVLWAQNNRDQYPMPSELDAKDTTLLPGEGDTKDLPRHMMSILIFNGFFSPEICVSPAEANPQIKIYDKYEYSTPTAATAPNLALWDPAFRATPVDSAMG